MINLSSPCILKLKLSTFSWFRILYLKRTLSFKRTFRCLHLCWFRNFKGTLCFCWWVKRTLCFCLWVKRTLCICYWIKRALWRFWLCYLWFKRTFRRLCWFNCLRLGRRFWIKLFWYFWFGFDCFWSKRAFWRFRCGENRYFRSERTICWYFRSERTSCCLGLGILNSCFWICLFYIACLTKFIGCSCIIFRILIYSVLQNLSNMILYFLWWLPIIIQITIYIIIWREFYWGLFWNNTSFRHFGHQWIIPFM